MCDKLVPWDSVRSVTNRSLRLPSINSTLRLRNMDKSVSARSNCADSVSMIRRTVRPFYERLSGLHYACDHWHQRGLRLDKFRLATDANINEILVRGHLNGGSTPLIAAATLFAKLSPPSSQYASGPDACTIVLIFWSVRLYNLAVGIDLRGGTAAVLFNMKQIRVTIHR